MNNVRLHFSKTFNARYISHLDLLRCFTRAFRLSGLDLWFTEGFNSRIYMTFALPLSLGFESLCETVDIRLVGDDIDSDIMPRVNAVLPFGIEVFDVGAAVMKPSDIAYSRYLIELDDDLIKREDIAEAAEKVLSRDEISIDKKTKKGIMKRVDVRPLIKSCGVSLLEGKCSLDLLAASSNDATLNPNVILSLIFEELGAETAHCLVKRTQILTNNMENFR